MHVFPELGRHQACRLVGCPGSPLAWWLFSRAIFARRRKGKKSWWQAELYSRVIDAIVGTSAKLPTTSKVRPVDSISQYRIAAPVANCINVTHELMGDPPPGRSALDQRFA